MTDFELFTKWVKGLSDSDVGQTHDGEPWVTFRDEETYTFFCFDKDNRSFIGCFSRRYSDHAEIEPPPPMKELRRAFQESLGVEE